MDNRRYELDFTRIIACLMVVLLHVAASGWYIDPKLPAWRYLNLADTMVRAGVSLFFMISGALFLNRKELHIKKFLLHNETHLLVIFAIWSLLYELYIQWIGPGYANVHEFLLAVIRGYYHLWFLPAMFIVYLFVPIIHSSIHEKKLQTKYLLFLFAAILIRENILLVPRLSDLVSTLLYKLDYSWIRYVGYMVLGYWLSNRKFGKKTRILCPIIYVLLTAAAAYGNRWYSIKINGGTPTGWLYGDYSFVTCTQAVCIFCFFQSFRDCKIRFPKLWTELSACTLGIYLLHPFFLDLLTRKNITVLNASPVKTIPCIYLIILAGSFLTVFVIRRIPILKKII